MKISSSLLLVLLLGVVAIGCSDKSDARTRHQVFEDQLVDISCGQCQFGMEGAGCDLAIRHDGASYYVSGSGIDDHGDAHADEGLCNCVRQAKVSGTFRDGRFHVSSIQVVDAATNAK